MVKYSRTTPWTSCHAWPNHMWPWQPNNKVSSSTNITIVVIHSVQNCRNMLVNYVLHSHDIILERYAYKKRRMETDNIPGDPTPISFQRCRRHEWLTRWNSGVTGSTCLGVPNVPVGTSGCAERVCLHRDGCARMRSAYPECPDPNLSAYPGQDGGCRR